MGRPPLERAVARLPRASLFKPAGIPARELDQVELTVDEVEALRLVDLDGLSHEQAAQSLAVSRQTVGRVLESARRKVADALVNGKALVIAGGPYQVSGARCCEVCGARWEGDATWATGTDDGTCPSCGSGRIRACVGPGGRRGAGRLAGPRVPAGGSASEGRPAAGLESGDGRCRSGGRGGGRRGACRGQGRAGWLGGTAAERAVEGSDNEHEEHDEH